MRRARLWLLLFVLGLFPGALLAAEEGSSTSGRHATELFQWINFAIVAGVILWLCVRKAPRFFRSRAEEIGSRITKATAAKALAERELREAEKRLAGLAQEIAGLRAQGENEALAEAERIRALTASDALKIRAAATAEILAAEGAARSELKRMAAALAMEGAESLLAKQLTAQVQEALVGDFVKSLRRSAS